MKKILLTLVFASSSTSFAGHNYQCDKNSEGLYQRSYEVFGGGEVILFATDEDSDKLFSSREKCEDYLGEACEVSERAMPAKACAEGGGDLLSTGECIRCY